MSWSALDNHHHQAPPARAAAIRGSRAHWWSASVTKHGDSNRSRLRSTILGVAILALATAALVELIRPASRQSGIVPAAPSHSGPTPKQRTARSAAAKDTVVDTRTITAALAADVSGLQGQYGVAVLDLSSGTTYGVNAQQSFTAASVNKLPILFTLYQRAELNGLDLDQTLTLSDADIQHYGTGTIQEANAPRAYSLRQLAQLMIEVSDNTAAYVLERFLGQALIQQNVERWGLTQTSMANNTTTPADAATLMASLDAGKLLGPDDSQAAMNLLENTVFTDRLAGGMPAGVPVAHKIGTDIGIFNDAGIVLLPQRAYAISVLTGDATQDQADAAYLRISQDVLSFERSLAATPTR